MRITTALPQKYNLSEANRERQESLLLQVEQINSDAAQYQTEADALANYDNAGWTSDDQQEASRLHARRIDLLDRELGLRGQIDEHFAEIKPDRSATINAAIAAHQQAQADVRAKLQGIGYTEADIDGPMIMRHPSVRNARMHESALRDTNSEDEHRRANAAAIERCSEELTKLRKRAAALLA